MARLPESPEVLEEIRQKAYRNAITQSTYGKKAEFHEGPRIVGFEEQCKSMKKLQLRYVAA